MLQGVPLLPLPATALSLISRYLIEPLNFRAGLCYTPRPYEQAYSYTNYIDNKVVSLHKIEFSVQARNETHMVSISCVPDVCWRWWPSLRVVDDIMRRPNTAATRQWLKVQIAQRTSIQQLLVHHNTNCLKRLLIKEILNTNENLWKKRFDNMHFSPITVTIFDVPILVTIPIILPARNGTFGKFVEDAHEDANWGVFRANTGETSRVLSCQLNDEHTCVVHPMPHAWEKHMWGTLSTHLRPNRQVPTRKKVHRSLRTLAPRRRLAVIRRQNYVH
jgi:hypothetical protein